MDNKRLVRHAAVLIFIYLCLSWLPQYLGRVFTPSVSAMPLSELGMDFYAVQTSAKHWLLGRSPRFLFPDGKDFYPYSIGGIFHAYGALSILLAAPFANLPLNIVRKIFLFLSLTILAGTMAATLGNRDKIRHDSDSRWEEVLWITAIIALSGPISLLLERGQLEVFVFPLLAYFYLGWIGRNPKASHAASLGLAIHLKFWPILLLALLFKRRFFWLFGVAIFVPAVLALILNPWFPVQEQLQAMRAYGDASALMLGWANVSLYSLITAFGWFPPWRILSGAIMILVGSFLVFAGNHPTTKSGQEATDLPEMLFAVALCAAFLTPAFQCDYTLTAAILLYPALSSGRLPGAMAAVVPSLLISNLLLFGYYAGVIKAAILLLTLIVAMARVFQSLMNVDGSTAQAQ